MKQRKVTLLLYCVCLAVLLLAAFTPSVCLAAENWKYPSKGSIDYPFGGGRWF